MNKIESVVAVTPVFQESEQMLRQLQEEVRCSKDTLQGEGIGLSHFFLDDGRGSLENIPVLVRHEKNHGLATTLLHGYEAVLSMEPKPDLVIRLDGQEHDAGLIPQIVDSFRYSFIQALFLPVWYWVAGQNRPPMLRITKDIERFAGSISPIDDEAVISVYNQKFPIGYQAFTSGALAEIQQKLVQGMKYYESRFGNPTWGLDLLAILVAASLFPEKIDFLFGGWMQPWTENINPQKIANQREKAVVMIDVARNIGCV